MGIDGFLLVTLLYITVDESHLTEDMTGTYVPFIKEPDCNKRFLSELSFKIIGNLLPIQGSKPLIMKRDNSILKPSRALIMCAADMQCPVPSCLY